MNFMQISMKNDIIPNICYIYACVYIKNEGTENIMEMMMMAKLRSDMME